MWKFVGIWVERIKENIILKLKKVYAERVKNEICQSRIILSITAYIICLSQNWKEEPFGSAWGT